jgi:hypothetical protein
MTFASPGIITPSFKPRNLGEYGDARANYSWWSHNFQKIADKDAQERHLFIWNPIQWELDNIVNTHRNVFGGFKCIGLKARQMGYSTYVTGRSSWKADTQENYRALHVAHDGDGTSNMLEMCKLAHNSLPDGLIKLPNGKTVQPKPIEKASNRAELKLWFDPEGTRESHIRIKTAGEKGDVGRSQSINFLHISEAGNDVFDDGQVYGASKQGLSQAGEVFIEGTPDGAYGWYYNAWLKAKDEWKAYLDALADSPTLVYNGLVPIFFPWFKMPAYSIPLADSEVIEPQTELEHKLMNGVITQDGYRVSRPQIKWMRFIQSDMPESLEMTPEQWFLQEYACNDHSCFITSGNNYFVGEYVEQVISYARQYEKEHKIRRYSFVNNMWVADPYGPLRLIEEPCNSATYVIGGDAAQGLEHGDYDTAIIIKRVVDGPDVVVGYWRTHEPDKGVHAMALAELGKWHNKALIAVENNPQGHGNTVNDALVSLGYSNVYVQTFVDSAKFKGGIESEYGFNTSAKTKAIYLRDFQTAVRKWCLNKNSPDGIIVPFVAIAEEMRTFQKVKNTTGAAKGSHDDLVIAGGIAIHLRVGVRPVYRNREVIGAPRPRMTERQFLTLRFGEKAADTIAEIRGK